MGPGLESPNPQQKMLTISDMIANNPRESEEDEYFSAQRNENSNSNSNAVADDPEVIPAEQETPFGPDIADVTGQQQQRWVLICSRYLPLLLRVDGDSNNAIHFPSHHSPLCIVSYAMRASQSTLKHSEL